MNSDNNMAIVVRQSDSDQLTANLEISKRQISRWLNERKVEYRPADLDSFRNYASKDLAFLIEQTKKIADDLLKANENLCNAKIEAQKYPDRRLFLIGSLEGTGGGCTGCTGTAVAITATTELALFSAGVLGIVTIYLFKQSYTTLTQSLPRSINAKTQEAASAEEAAIEKACDRLIEQLGMCKESMIAFEKEKEIAKLSNTNKNTRRAQRRLQIEENQVFREDLRKAISNTAQLTQGLEKSEAEKKSLRRESQRFSEEIKKNEIFRKQAETATEEQRKKTDVTIAQLKKAKSDADQMRRDLDVNTASLQNTENELKSTKLELSFTKSEMAQMRSDHEASSASFRLVNQAISNVINRHQKAEAEQTQQNISVIRSQLDTFIQALMHNNLEQPAGRVMQIDGFENIEQRDVEMQENMRELQANVYRPDPQHLAADFHLLRAHR